MTENANTPEFLESNFVLNGDLDTLAENFLDNLYQRRNWGISYVETYTNSDGFPVYLVSGIHVRNKTSNQHGILGFTIKLIGIHKEQAEVWVISTYVNTDGFPFRQLSHLFNNAPIMPDADEHAPQHTELLAKVSEYCTQSYGEGMTPGEIFRKLLRTFNHEKIKRR